MVTMKCLLQAYASEIAKQSTNFEVCKKLRLKSLHSLVSYFESSQNNVAAKEWEFLKILVINLKQRYDITFKDEVDLHLWQTVYLGTNLVKLFYEGSIEKFRIAIEIAELG